MGSCIRHAKVWVRSGHSFVCLTPVQIVEIDGAILEKPANAADAVSMLQRCGPEHTSNNTHCMDAWLINKCACTRRSFHECDKIRLQIESYSKQISLLNAGGSRVEVSLLRDDSVASLMLNYGHSPPKVINTQQVHPLLQSETRSPQREYFLDYRH